MTTDFRLYRFSPIQNKDELFEAIRHVHFSCHQLCKQSFGEYLPNSGNIGVFCHYDEEYDRLIALRKEMTKPSDDPNQKYFELYEPIVIPSDGDVPEVTYTHLYIRKPDIYRYQVGDVDFYVEQNEYDKLKHSLLDGSAIPGARIFPRTDLDMIELYDPDVDACGYVSTHVQTQKVHKKLSDETKL